MYKGKPVQYRGFVIRKDQSDRYVVLAPSVADGELTEINDKLQTLSLAKDWIDQTQFD